MHGLLAQPPRHRVVAALLGLCLALLAWRAEAASDVAVKAGFVYNFSKFAEWPADSFATNSAPLNLCVVGNQPLGGQLLMLQGRIAQGHAINLRGNARGEDLRACHIVFVGDSEERRVASVLAQVGGSPVLTVSDIDGFAEQGGIIGLSLNGERVEFTVNLRAARQAGIKLNSQLLRLGRVVQ
jgi:hypothetical protein